jgi:release factor glutamine methyltransferase
MGVPAQPRRKRVRDAPMGKSTVMRLATLPGVFRPRSDSWLLARLVAERTKPGNAVLDPFTGSGVLAIAAAARGGRATAVDISRRAVFCAAVNARLNGVSLRTLRAADLSGLGDERFDLIVANPPYLPGPAKGARGAARAWEGGPDGRRFIDRLCDEASLRLRAGGRLLMVHSSVCDEQATLDRLACHGLRGRVIARHHGALGPLLAKRAGYLKEAGLLNEPDAEELLVFEALCG